MITQQVERTPFWLKLLQDNMLKSRLGNPPGGVLSSYSTVTLLARLRGLSTSRPRSFAT